MAIDPSHPDLAMAVPALPAFSVIVPTYNRPRQLAACLSALRRIDYPRSSWELIVVDDGSATPLNGVVQHFTGDLNLKLLRQPNAGPAAARNAGAAAARGQFLAFTDDDCSPDPHWLLQLAQRLSTCPLALCGGRVVNHLDHNPYAATSQAILDVCYSHFDVETHPDAFFASNNMALSAECFAAIGGFDSTFTTSEDRDLCRRWRCRGWPLLYVPTALIGHANDLNFRGFWRQHFSYGRGAWRFHSQRSADGRARFQPDWRFYHRFLSLPAQVRPPSRAAAVGALLFIWQLANAAGFYYQKLTNRPPRPLAAKFTSRPSDPCRYLPS